MRFWKVSPIGAIGDLIAYWRQPTPYHWPIVVLSVGVTGTLMGIFIPPSERAAPSRPEVTYITTFSPDRTDDEIVATNIENQRLQDRIRAEQEARAELKREAYKALGRASGFDVEAMEAQAERERAAEEAARAERAERAQARLAQQQAATASAD